MPGGVGAGTLLLVPAGSSVVVGMGVGEDPTIVCCSGPTQSLEYPESSLVPPPVIAFMVETTGGIAPHALAHVGHLAMRAKGKSARSRDGTKYGRSRTSTRSFFVHHTQRIATAAQMFDARGIRKALALRKQSLMKGSTGAA